MPNTNIESLESHREAEQKPADPQQALDALRQQMPDAPVTPETVVPPAPVAPSEGQVKAA